MNIQIISTSSFVNANGIYTTVQLECEKVKVTITRVNGKKYSYVNVTVQNASHRAYKGFGKMFKTNEEAIENYKNEKIKAMIQFEY